MFALLKRWLHYPTEQDRRGAARRDTIGASRRRKRVHAGAERREIVHRGVKPRGWGKRKWARPRRKRRAAMYGRRSVVGTVIMLAVLIASCGPAQPAGTGSTAGQAEAPR